MWARWMNDQYVQGRSLDEILPKQEDSSIWKGVLAKRNIISKCTKLGSQNSMFWMGKGQQATYKNIIRTLEADGEKDYYARGVCVAEILKHAMALWRLRSE